MNCPLCGKTYPCVHSRRSQGTTADSGNIGRQDSRLQDSTFQDSSAEEVAQASPYGASAYGSFTYGSIPVEVSARGVEVPTGENPAGENDVWREQVASRVLLHRAKRKGSDPDPNLELRFPVQEAPVDERIMRARRFVAHAATKSPFADDSPDQCFTSSAVASLTPVASMGVTAGVASEPFAMEEMPKVIHFPRSSGSQRGTWGACQRP